MKTFLIISNILLLLIVFSQYSIEASTWKQLLIFQKQSEDYHEKYIEYMNKYYNAASTIERMEAKT